MSNDPSDLGWHDQLSRWFVHVKRDLPWRKNADPYAILVSETMLQQTTVKAVVPYFERWMDRLPNFAALAEASEGELLSLWAGLGYYSRCRRLHQTGKTVVATGVPTTFEGWLELPGVGPYTAAAVSSLCFGLPCAVVDGNVERVYSRMNVDPSVSAKLRQAAQRWADKAMCRASVNVEPGAWNESLMELGATVCRPKSPLCDQCPVSDNCQAHQSGSTHIFPTKVPRLPPQRLEHTIWVVAHEEKFGVVQSAEGQWWAGMWGFLRTESSEVPELLRNASSISIGTFRHTVTRYDIRVDVRYVELVDAVQGLTWVGVNKLERLAFPNPQLQALRLLRIRLADS